jgi:hypothetical protein
MLEQRNSIRELFAAIVLGLYGVYLAITGCLIILKGRKILGPNHYVQIFLMKFTGNYEKAFKYEERLKAEINWPRHGIYILVGGIFVILVAVIMFLSFM